MTSAERCDAVEDAQKIAIRFLSMPPATEAVRPPTHLAPGFRKSMRVVNLRAPYSNTEPSMGVRGLPPAGVWDLAHKKRR